MDDCRNARRASGSLIGRFTRSLASNSCRFEEAMDQQFRFLRAYCHRTSRERPESTRPTEPDRRSITEVLGSV
jgi:hypothetical protein